MLKTYEQLNLRFLIVRDAIISYARPFSDNNGILLKKWKLPEKFIPKKYKDLHKELINMRDRVIAHSDMDFIDPSVVNRSSSKGKWFPMSLKNFHSEFKNLSAKWQAEFTE